MRTFVRFIECRSVAEREAIRSRLTAMGFDCLFIGENGLDVYAATHDIPVDIQALLWVKNSFIKALKCLAGLVQ